MAPNPHFYELIASRRYEKNLSQARLAKLLSQKGTPATQAFISRVESGEKLPGHEMLTALAEILEIPSDLLLAISGKIDTAKIKQQAAENIHYAQLMLALEKDLNAQQVLDLLHFLGITPVDDSNIDV